MPFQLLSKTIDGAPSHYIAPKLEVYFGPDPAKTGSPVASCGVKSQVHYCYFELRDKEQTGKKSDLLNFFKPICWLAKVILSDELRRAAGGRHVAKVSGILLHK